MSLIEHNSNKTAPKTPATAVKRHQIRGKLKTALDLMVFGEPDAGALAWNDAARKAGFSVQAMRYALDRAHVRAYLKEQRDVFRSAVCARSISRLDKIADASGNAMAQLGAIRALEQLDYDASDITTRPSPGFALVIVQQGTTVGTTMIDAVTNKPADAGD